MKFAVINVRNLAWLTVLYATTLMAQSAPFNIVIQRGPAVGDLVTGTISVNGQQLGETYENDSLKIPAGTYAGLLRYVSGKNFVGGPFGTISKAGDFLVEVSGVDGGRTDILLHGGNKPHHSSGCILLGPVGREPGTSIPSLDDQHPLRKLRLLFYGTDVPNSTPNKQIKIQINDSAENGHYDLAGTWQRDDGELDSITQTGERVVAVKLSVNATSNVRSSEVSWQGDYTSNSFAGRGQRGYKDGRRYWIPVRIIIQSKNTIRVTGFIPDRTYTRKSD